MGEATGPERTHRHGIRASLPLAIAVFGFGLSFGVLARASGMGPVAPIVMSAVTFAGSAQFAAIQVLGVGGSVAAAVSAAVLLNARYGPIGVSVAPYLTGSWWSRLLHAQLVVADHASIAGGRDDEPADSGHGEHGAAGVGAPLRRQTLRVG